MNNEFKNAPEGTTHKLNGEWYDINSGLETGDDKFISVKIFTVGSYWGDLCLFPKEGYIQLQPREPNLWYDFEKEVAINFPTKADKFLYDGQEARIIGVSVDGANLVLDCADGLRKLTAEDLELITPIETPEVEQRLKHTLKGQVKGMRKFLKSYDSDVNLDKDTLELLYNEGWRISKVDTENA